MKQKELVGYFNFVGILRLVKLCTVSRSTMDRNDDRDADRQRRGAPVPRTAKLAPLDKNDLPSYDHLRHIMSEITKYTFFRQGMLRYRY
jgi:hypothetical protein